MVMIWAAIDMFSKVRISCIEINTIKAKREASLLFENSIQNKGCLV